MIKSLLNDKLLFLFRKMKDLKKLMQKIMVKESEDHIYLICINAGIHKK